VNLMRTMHLLCTRRAPARLCSLCSSLCSSGSVQLHSGSSARRSAVVVATAMRARYPPIATAAGRLRRVCKHSAAGIVAAAVRHWPVHREGRERWARHFLRVTSRAWGGQLQAVLRRGDEEHGTCPAHPVGDNANAQDGATISPSGEVCLALEGAAEERRDSRREWGSAVWTSRWSRSSRKIWKPVAEELARLAHGRGAASRLHVRCGR
jgi:hypothetical protein